MSEPILNGLMMDDFPLSLTTVVERSEQLTGDRKVVSRRPDGSIHRTTMGECAVRARRLASALAELGIGEGDRVGTLLWNQPEHLELYFGVPAMGSVIHTLNPRLHPDELGFIAGDAGDRAIVVDESILPVLDSFRSAHEFEHVIVVSQGAEVPEGTIDYEWLIEGAEPMSWPEPHERRAAAICYTSGTTGRPKGVLYSHRALVLHSMAAALPDAMNISTRDTVLPVVPMFHANAWGIPYTASMVGAALVLPGPRLDAESVLDLLADEHVTFTAGVPTVWMAMLKAMEAEPERWDLSSLEAPPGRRLGRSQEHDRGLPAPWPAHRAGLGHDRDLPARQHGDRAPGDGRRSRRREVRVPRASGRARSVRRDSRARRRRRADPLGR